MKFRNTLKTCFNLAVVALLSVNSFAQAVKTIEITNPVDVSRPDELIRLQRAEIEKQLRSSAAAIAVSISGEDLPVQYIDNDGDGKWDEAVFLYSFKARQKAAFKITASTTNVFAGMEQRAHVRLRKRNPDNSFGPHILKETMPVRNPATDFSTQLLPNYLTEGPAWENDKVAFRLYFDVRNNKDIFGKTTSKMMMDTIGTNYKDSYHNLSAWGMDLLHVVRSLGAGALALVVPQAGGMDTLIRLGGGNITKTEYQQITDGPLLAQFTLTYECQINGGPVQLQETISIWAGQYFYQSKVEVRGAPAGAKLVTGMANFYDNTFDTLTWDKAVVGYSFGKQSENKDNLGLGILVSSQNFTKVDSLSKSERDISETYLVEQTLTENRPAYYRFYAAWEKTDSRFLTIQGFKEFLLAEAKRCSNPVIINWKKEKGKERSK